MTLAPREHLRGRLAKGEDSQKSIVEYVTVLGSAALGAGRFSKIAKIATTWLANVGWRQHGGGTISVHELPRFLGRRR